MTVAVGIAWSAHGLLFTFRHLKCKKQSHLYLWPQSMLSESVGSPWKTDGTSGFHCVSPWVTSNLICHTDRQRWPEYQSQSILAAYLSGGWLSGASMESSSVGLFRCPDRDVFSMFPSKPGRVRAMSTCAAVFLPAYTQSHSTPIAWKHRHLHKPFIQAFLSQLWCCGAACAHYRVLL